MPRKQSRSEAREPVGDSGSLAGEVLDDAGRNVPGAGIHLHGSTHHLVASAVTGPHGEFTLEDVEPGDYLLFVNPPPGYLAIDPLPVFVKKRNKSRFVILLGKAAAAPGPASTGAKGASGPSGVAGLKGSTGATDPAGPVGPSGPTGTGGGYTLASGPCGFPSPSGPDDGNLSDFFATLDSPDLSIEAPVSEPEAIHAINLFSVVNVYLGGVSTRRVGNDDKMDVLGMLTLYYGLQDKSLTSKIVIRTPQLWTEIQDELKALRDGLDLLGSDVVFLAREARRQFNLGFNHDVAGNVDFPNLFQQFVDMANNPLLTLDLSVEGTSPFADKAQVARAYDFLSELKDLTVEIVRTLSRNGTVATNQINQQWADYQKRAFVVLKQVADARISDDVDELRILSVVADLTGKDFSSEVAPYIALARDGGCLLSLAMEAYRASAHQLDNYDRTELLRVFQAGTPDTFLTARIRNRAVVVKKYPLRNWGTG